MKLLAGSAPLPILFAITLCALFPLESTAQFATNGYVCVPKSIGAEVTQKYFRQQEGVVENLSKTDTFPVVCPLVIDYWTFGDGSAVYGALIGVKNGDKVNRTFKCALEEYNVLGIKERSIGRSVTVAAGDLGVVDYGPLFVASDFNYSTVRCILPPGGMITAVNWF